MSRRLCVLGLDGLGLALARDLAGRGVMPRLGELLAAGRAWGLKSPLPEVSPVCWTSIFSGLSPAGHGVYGFANCEPMAYRLRPAFSTDVRAQRIWERASAAGLKSVVLNVPLTYPAAPIKGAMVSGFVCPELRGGVHPSTLLPRLLALGYRPEADLEAGRSDPAGFMDDLLATLRVRLEMFEQMLEEDWDLYVAVVTDLDRVNHFLWPALFDGGHALADQALAAYALVDGFVGRVARRLGAEQGRPDPALLICADHGFGPVASEVYLNRFLLERGWLQVEGEPPHERILPGTKALALDPGRIYLHYRGRFPQGRLEPGPEAEALATRIREDLLALSCPGTVGASRPVARVHFKQELYCGPYADQAPDLVAEAAPGFSLRAGLDRSTVFGKSHITGTHRPEDALALWLGSAPEGTPVMVTDLFRCMTMALWPEAI